MKTGGQDYIVRIAIRYRLDSPGIIYWWGQDCSFQEVTFPKFIPHA